MEELKSEEFRFCLHLLGEAESPLDALVAWHSLGKQHPNLSAMICLSNYDQSVIPPAIKKYTSPLYGYLVPYFSSEKMYFLNDSLLLKMSTSGEQKIRIDYTLMFDTNVASYINKLIRLEPVGKIQEKIVPLLSSLLYDDLNFDHLFYLVENVKDVLPHLRTSTPTKLAFWKLLDPGFRKNVVSLQIFRSIDCKEYRRTSKIVPSKSYRAAAREAINFCYDFYASDVGRDHILGFVLVQRLILLQLIGMVRIQLASAKSAKYKMGEFLKFINNDVGAYFDREAIIAHTYFNDRASLEILGKIQKGCRKKGLLKKLDNIAWDMAAPRFMEKLVHLTGDGDYFVPLFLSFDSKLRDLLRVYPVKGAVFNRKTGLYVPIPSVSSKKYFAENGCGPDIEKFFSESVKSERFARPRPDLQSVYRSIKREFRHLRALV